jgi:hypothetical protein
VSTCTVVVVVVVVGGVVVVVVVLSGPTALPSVLYSDAVVAVATR